MQGCRVSPGLLYYMTLFMQYKIFTRPSLQRLEKWDASTRIPTTVRGLVVPVQRAPKLRRRLPPETG